ncbi:hypothetical protein DH2020_021291 [Rehmannia glutinosa]|uniref:ATP synthase subunit d, mitochondrial n=1 Tax=Rehmannia glutinosa TaxID=99300 RepID=A0ABR0WA00_REHGL
MSGVGRRWLTWHSRLGGPSTGMVWRSCLSPMRLAGVRHSPPRLRRGQHSASDQEPEPIDWEYYRKGIGSRLVDVYKQAYDEVKIPQYVDNVTPQYKPKFDALLVELKEAEEMSWKESERLEKEIAEVQELKEKFSTMTADEYFAKHPSSRRSLTMKLEMITGAISFNFA